MSGIINDYGWTVYETGMPGSGSLDVGYDEDSLDEAISNLSSTPYGAHQSPREAVYWALDQYDDIAVPYPEEGSVPTWDNGDHISNWKELMDAGISETTLERMSDDSWEWLLENLSGDPVLLKTTYADPYRHETAEEWYENYGWHYPTEYSGDVMLQAVDFNDAVSGDTEKSVKNLMHRYSDLLDDEAASIVKTAEGIASDAVTVIGLAEEVVKYWEVLNTEGVFRALEDLSNAESEHGDDPVAQFLRSEILIRG